MGSGLYQILNKHYDGEQEKLEMLDSVAQPEDGHQESECFLS